MPKSTRGGKTVTNGRLYTTTIAGGTQQTSPTPDDETDDNATQQAPATQVNANLQQFRAMSDDDKADAINALAKTPVPTFLSDSDLQRITYGLKMNDKPKLVDDSELDTIKGKDLYRTVNAYNDNVNRIKYTAPDIADQTLRGSVTRVSDSGGSAYGRGIYFADSYRESGMYGRRYNNLTQTAVIRGKIASSAKTISSHSAAVGVRNEINSGSKLGKALSKLDSSSKISVYALAKGYDVMTTDVGYYVVLNRGAMVMSKDIRATNTTQW